jgi:hypothetical protein
MLWLHEFDTFSKTRVIFAGETWSAVVFNFKSITFGGSLYQLVSLIFLYARRFSLLSLESLPSPVAAAFAFCPVCLRAARFALCAALTLSPVSSASSSRTPPPPADRRPQIGFAIQAENTHLHPARCTAPSQSYTLSSTPIQGRETVLVFLWSESSRRTESPSFEKASFVVCLLLCFDFSSLAARHFTKKCACVAYF